MSNYNSVFKRVEKKYRLDAQGRGAMELAMLDTMAVDGFGRSVITSLYLDTPERAMIARSVEKPLYKEKLRLRAYGEAHSRALIRAFSEAPVRREVSQPLSEVQVMLRTTSACKGLDLKADEIPIFFEIKKKFKGVVYKRRLVMSLPAAFAFFSGLSFERAALLWPLKKQGETIDSPTNRERQIARELEATMDRWSPLVPSMGISCYREAWTLKADAKNDGFDSSLRITFDDSLRYFDCFAKEPRWQPLIEGTEAIMEIKSAGPYRPWLVKALSSHHIYPASFTKYGTAFETVTKKGEPTCSMQPSPRSLAALTH